MTLRLMRKNIGILMNLISIGNFNKGDRARFPLESRPKILITASIVVAK